MKIAMLIRIFGLACCLSHSLATWAAPLAQVKTNKTWTNASEVSAIEDKIQISSSSDDGQNILVNAVPAADTTPLIHDAYLSDALVTMEYLLPADARAYLLLQKRYQIKLTGLNNEWQHIEVKYRTARFDQALKKTEPVFVLQVKVNAEVTATNLAFNDLSEHALDNWENPAGRMAVLANWGPFALRNFKVQSSATLEAYYSLYSFK